MATTSLMGRTGVNIKLKNVEALPTKIDEVLDELNISTSIKWSYGRGLKQCDVLFHEKLTIAAEGVKTLDLYASADPGPALQDAFGNDLTMEAIKFLFIQNRSKDFYVEIFGGNDKDLLIMVPAATENVDKLKIKPEGFFQWADPSIAGIVTTTNKNLKFTVAAGTGDDAIIDVVAMGLD